MKNINKGVTTQAQLAYEKPIDGSATYTFSGNVVVTEPNIPITPPTPLQFDLKLNLSDRKEVAKYIEEYTNLDSGRIAEIVNEYISKYPDYRYEDIIDEYFSNPKLSYENLMQEDMGYDVSEDEMGRYCSFGIIKDGVVRYNRDNGFVWFAE